MTDCVFTCGGVELREASGETYTTVVHDGVLTVKMGAGGPSIEVDGNAVDWVAAAPAGPFKRVDSRSFSLATNDLLSFTYITLPRGLPDARYEHFNAVLTAIRDGQPIPAAATETAETAVAPAAAAETAAAAAAPAAAGAAGGAQKPAGGNPLDLLKAIADKAAHDTLVLGNAIKQKAEHDMKQFQEQQQQQPKTS